MTGPLCMHCEIESVRVAGSTIYPHRPDLFDRDFFLCEECGAYCGTHKQTGEPLGRPAGPELRKARQLVHRRFDPIWLEGWRAYGSHFDKKETAKFRRIARKRAYAYLASKLGLSRDECHTALFNIDQCRAAWVALSGVDYDRVRGWCKSTQTERKAA